VRRGHFEELGRWPRLAPPETLNERIIHRILYDRDPRLKTISDKIAVKDFIAKAVGDSYPVPLLGQWRRAEDVAWSDLPQAFVLKPNQTSGPFIIAEDKRTADRDAILSEAAGWLRRRMPFLPEVRAEWGYQGLPRRIMAEPLLLAPEGGVVREINVFTFGGRAALVRLYSGRKLTKERSDGWFDLDGRQLAIRTNHLLNTPCTIADDIRREAVAVSERLSEGFSSMRVDFYITETGLLVGELTPYSWGGKCHFHPPELDARLGELWHSLDTSTIPTYAGNAAGEEAA